MSLRRDDFIQHLKNNEFEAILEKIKTMNPETDGSDVTRWFCHSFFDTDTPSQWLDFLVFLTNKQQKFFNIPDDLIYFICDIFENEKSKEDKYTDRCIQLLKLILKELESSPTNTLTGNKLALLQDVLEELEIHTSLLYLITRIDAQDQKIMYGYLLNCYIERPVLLYQAFLISNAEFSLNIINRLKEVTSDAEMRWFIDTLERLINDIDPETIEEVLYNLVELNNNYLIQMEFTNVNSEDLIKLKMIATQSSKVINKVATLLEKDKVASEQLESLAKFKDKLVILEFTNQMAKFLNGYGQLKYNEALLTCAQISARKKYLFDPLIFNENSEFERFLLILRSHPKPFRKKFVITGDHWICGDIQIDVDGYINIAFFDSLGRKVEKEGNYFSTTLTAMKLANKTFPLCKIYISNDKRQNAMKGCSVFALDDLMHLFTLEKYLTTNLFDYLDQHVTLVDHIKKDSEQLYDDLQVKGINYLFNIYCCQPPLTLMRTAQSETLVSTKIPQQTVRPFLSIPINKQGELFATSATRHFKADYKFPHKRLNTRLERQLEKITMQNAAYLLKYDSKTIQQATATFTLKHFMEEMKKNKPERPTSIIHQAILDNDPDKVDQLLLENCDPNELDENGNTPLHRAIIDKNSIIISYLLECGADPYIKNPRNRSAVDLARHYVKNLDSAAKNNFLVIAIKSNNTKAVAAFLENGANPNDFILSRNFGETPLHMAVREGNGTIIALLLKHHAKPTTKSSSSKKTSPFQFALHHSRLNTLFPFFQYDQTLAQDYLNTDFIQSSATKDEWNIALSILICLPHTYQLPVLTHTLIIENISAIFNELLRQAALTDDQNEKVEIFMLASNPSTMLGSMLAKKPEYMQKISEEFERLMALADYKHLPLSPRM